MSTQIATITGKDNQDTIFSQYKGQHGVMVQITQGFGGINTPGYIQLTLEGAYQTIDQLAKWIKDVTKNQAEKLQKEIDKNTALKKTIVQDSVDCQHFIDDLEILKIPIRLLDRKGGR